MMTNPAGQAQAAPAGQFRPRTHISIHGRAWHINDRPVHPGTPAEGLLTNIRMVNCIFEDTGPAAAMNLPAGFDPAENTRRFLRRIPDYLGHGAIAFTISLQGGLPGYEGAVNSAFNADGMLREGYMGRAAQVIEACDRSGAVVILSCFYQRQHAHERALTGRDAIRSAVANVARWIRSRGYRNVLLEISNEYRHNGFQKWNDGAWLASDAGQVDLIRLARQTAPGLLVSTSGMGSGQMSAKIAEVADFLLIHFNNTALQDIPQRIADARRFGRPVVCNEDNKLGVIGAEAARLAITSGAGWGFMHAPKNQNVPFEFDGAADDPEVYAMLRHLTSAGTAELARSAATAAAGLASPASAPATAVASIVITQPRDGDTFEAGQSILIVPALTSPAGESPARVEILANGRLVAAASAAPWKILWPDVPAGNYDLVAVQRDAQGRELARSNAVDIVVMRSPTKP
jgi:hypothetical protein